MAKAIFERSEDSFADKPVTTTPVRDVSRAKKSGPGEFTVKAEGGEAKAKVVPGADRTTVYKKLGDNEGYPRGFNPQQMGEVRQAENTGRMALFSSSAMENGRKHAEHEKSLVRETIARSKYNPMDLKTTNPLTGNASPLSINVKWHPETGTSGEYTPENRQVAVEPTALHGDTLIHEIGHDVMHHDAPVMTERDDLAEPHRQDAITFVNGFGGRIDFNSEKEPVGYHGPRHLTPQVFSHLAKWADKNNGYSEGYANKFADAHYVQDPRARQPHEHDDIYRLEAFLGPHAPSESRLNAFSHGYLKAGGPVVPLHDPQLGFVHAQSLRVPPSQRTAVQTSTRAPVDDDFYFHPQTVIDAVEAARAARNSTDDEVRGTNG
jgi:hypothetical protein